MNKLFYKHDGRIWFRWKIGKLSIYRGGVSLGELKGDVTSYGYLTGLVFEIRWNGVLKYEKTVGYIIK